MKSTRIIFILLLSSLSLSFYAQDTIYIDRNNKWLKKAKNAESYLIILQADNLTKVDTYVMNGTLKSKGSYSSFQEKPANCIKEGEFISFYPNGNPKVICEYHNNKRNGKFLKFYENGKEKLISNYSHGKKEGSLTMFYQDGSIWRKDTYRNNDLTEGHLYDKEGIEINHTPIESMPQYPGGVEAMREFISKNLVYPPRALKRKQEGRVVVQFTVDQEGLMKDPKVVMRIDDELDRSAMSIINKMANEVRWKPGIQDGEPVKVKYTVPITFKIP